MAADHSPAKAKFPAIQIERAGIQSLLDRLQTPLKLSFEASIPAQQPDVLFSADWGNCRYSRLATGEMRLENPDHPYVMTVSTAQQQLTIWGMDEAQATRQLWHGLIRYGMAAYLSDRGYTPIHAAALIDPTGFTWLIAGKTHSGKSTLVVGLLEAGWQFLSDDSLILATEQDAIAAHAWLGTSLIDPILTQTYPHLEQELGDRVVNRRLINFQNGYGSQWVAKAQPHGILFPCFSETTAIAALESLSPGTALAQLMAHSAPWLMESPQNHLPKLQRLCSQCQYFNLLLGYAMRTEPHQVARVLLEAINPTKSKI